MIKIDLNEILFFQWNPQNLKFLIQLKVFIRRAAENWRNFNDIEKRRGYKNIITKFWHDNFKTSINVSRPYLSYCLIYKPSKSVIVESGQVESTLGMDSGYKNKKIVIYPKSLRPFLRIYPLSTILVYTCRRGFSPDQNQCRYLHRLLWYNTEFRRIAWGNFYCWYTYL